MHFKTKGVKCIIVMYVKKSMYILKYQRISWHIATVRAWSHGSELLVLPTSTKYYSERGYAKLSTSLTWR